MEVNVTWPPGLGLPRLGLSALGRFCQHCFVMDAALGHKTVRRTIPCRYSKCCRMAVLLLCMPLGWTELRMMWDSYGGGGRRS